MEESKITRQKAQEASAASGQDEDTSVLDNLLEKLRNGDTVGRRARRTRPSTENCSAVPSTLNTDGITVGANDTADIARDMLARLQSDGFQAFIPTPAIESSTRRQTRRRRAGNNLSIHDINELDLASPEMGSESLPDEPLGPELAESADEMYA